MSAFSQHLAALNRPVHDFLWGPVMLFLFLAVGLYFSLRTRFFQFTQFRLWFRTTFLSCFPKKQSPQDERDKDSQSISPFQAMCTALAATTGTGNIAGVATAITLGGPGAVFWMWVSAFLGMMTGYAENLLGNRYRYRNAQGEWSGGAYVYIERGLEKKWLALLYALLCLLASFGMGNLAQANSIAQALSTAFRIPPLVTSLTVSILAAAVILGGVRRIARFTSWLVPFMSLFYLAGALVILFFHISALPQALALILQEAFRPRACIGGTAGYGIMKAMGTGISRGVFSNEAGLGSSVLAHTAANIEEPAQQGMWNIFEVFADTIVMCTLTALVILTSGVYDSCRYAALLGTPDFWQLPNAAALTGMAFGSVFGKAGSRFIAVSITLFAFSTLVSWAWYGEQAAGYLFGPGKAAIYRVLFSCLIAIGCLADLGLVWELSDTFNGLMAIPNLIALVLLRRDVVDETKRYLSLHGAPSSGQ